MTSPLQQPDPEQARYVTETLRSAHEYAVREADNAQGAVSRATTQLAEAQAALADAVGRRQALHSELVRRQSITDQYAAATGGVIVRG
jgi:hypothetical protein